jgi:hypothetical protein
MGFWKKVGRVLGIPIKLEDSGQRQCENGEFCNDPDCTHKLPHKKNSGCLNGCQRGAEPCFIYYNPKE